MKTLVIGLASILLITPLLAHADCKPSWCKYAKTQSEKAVCKSRVLRSADELMVQIYKQIIKNPNVLMGMRGAIKDDQKKFLKRREDVAYSEQALQNVYLNRILELQTTLREYQDDI